MSHTIRFHRHRPHHLRRPQLRHLAAGHRDAQGRCGHLESTRTNPDLRRLSYARRLWQILGSKIVHRVPKVNWNIEGLTSDVRLIDIAIRWDETPLSFNG